MLYGGTVDTTMLVGPEHMCPVQNVTYLSGREMTDKAPFTRGLFVSARCPKLSCR
jgi:hypothetical protein